MEGKEEIACRRLASVRLGAITLSLGVAACTLPTCSWQSFQAADLPALKA